MKKLYAPWRSTYAESIDQSKQAKTKKIDCVFCAQLKKKEDKKQFILHRGEHTFIMLNKYPYNAGHLLIMPLAHAATLAELTHEARSELIELTNSSIEILKNILGAEGVNVGINLGKAAGAGIPSHLHTHILPRWNGDTNFLPTLCDTKQISFDLGTLYTKLKPAFDRLGKKQAFLRHRAI